MSSFLHLLAADIIKKYPDFEDVTIIFPNKRAGLFLAEELGHHIEQPVWMPKITTLADFIDSQTGFHKPEDLTLVIKLYKAYTEVSGSEEKFEDFYFWGNMLLNDFDDIDKFLVDAKALFSNLVSLKELEYSVPYLSAEQTEIIKKFWKSFNPDKYSKEQVEFLKVWDQLYAVYTRYKEMLFAENLAYEGMALRHYTEHLESHPHQGPLVFAGFNALNTCQKRLFSYFRDNGQAVFYWDYDIYYSANEFHEAGKYIRENLKMFPNEIGKEHFNNFKYNEKKIAYISVPSSVGQAKLIPELTRNIGEKEYTQTAIVLCDERMLLPVMHSIPEHIRKINITMGYPAQNTSVASLIYLLGELKKYSKPGRNGCYYYYKPVVAILNHKLVKDGCSGDIDRITNYINQKNIVYVTGKYLHFNALTKAIFSSEDEKTAGYILRILQLLSHGFDTDEALVHPIEKEFIFHIYTQLQCLQNTFTEEGIEPEDKLYMQIINKVVNSITIPFSGEPLEGLQVMGMLETRMIDFRNLVVLSANEGIIPRTSVTPSFIPYNLRVGFKLPTPEHQDALYAYYFYRLLQRAENITVLYTSAVKGMNSGEMSRYLYQIKYESGLEIRENSFQNHISVLDQSPIEISKNDNILNRLKLLGESEEHCISPSALNTYIDCPLKFYFKYPADIKEKDEMAEELDHRLLGNIFHESAESLYSTVAGEEITVEVIDRLLRNQRLIDQHIQKSYLNFYDQQVSQLIDSGSNELILVIIRKYLRQMFRYDRKICPFRLISMERKYCFPVEIEVEHQRHTVYIGGIIDRVDETEEVVRIIDYKTGADTTVFKNVESVFNGENPLRNKAAFQTMLYCLMFSHQHKSDKPLTPGIYSTKLLFDPDYNHLLKCDKDFMINFDRFREEFEGHLKQLLERIYSPHLSFAQNGNSKKCRTCPYSGICRK